MHRPSLVGPVVVLSIGVVALLIEAGKLNSMMFWDWFLRWWPILLIAVGLVSLLEWFLDRGALYQRRRGTFGIVLLISILVGIAYSQGHMRRWADQAGINEPENWPAFMGDEHDHDTDSTMTIPANASVQVQNPRGDVTITGSSDSQMHVHAHQVVVTNSDDEATRIFPVLDPKVTVSGSVVLVNVEGRNNAHADLTIELPASASTDVTAGRGDVSVDGLKGSSNINAARGDVKVSEIGGSVHAHMSKGDFSAHQIGGSVTLDGHVNDATISEIGGTVSLDGDFFGDTHLEQIASTVHFHSSRTDMQVARLAGDLTLDDDDLHVGQAVGPLRIVTRSKNIECSQVSGDVHIENSNGEVTVTAVEPLGNIQITNASDPVTLILPPNAGFTINAKTDNGDFNSDFTLNVSGSDEHHTAEGTVGKGGPKIDVVVRHGDLSIKKGDTSLPPIPAIPAVPAKPLPPEPPGGPEKHLRAPKDATPTPSVL
jgi:DUF4097 and DUF4098 domain-containing protein YvlB